MYSIITVYLEKETQFFSPFIVLFSGALPVLTIIVIAQFTSYSNPHKS